MRRLLLISILILGSIQFVGFGATLPIEYAGASQEHRSSAHSYSNSLNSAYDESNSSYAFIVVRGCDSGSCTQESYYDVDYTLSPLSSPDNLEFEWNIQPYDSFTPTNSITNISLFSFASQTWHVKVSQLGTISGWELVNIDITSDYIQPSGDIELRVSGYHEDTGEEFSDELGIWIREFHLYSEESEPLDTDQDGITDAEDSCPDGNNGWTSNSNTDYDSDGCQDSGEDLDDDNDGVSDDVDTCNIGDLFTSNPVSDYDGDGCKDDTEDNDDDGDTVNDGIDQCEKGVLNWISNSDTDYDGDGCNDDTPEDPDDDNDGWSDAEEIECGTLALNNSSLPLDGDSDGICDANDIKNLDYAKNGNKSEVFEAVINESNFTIIPNLTGMESGTWSISPTLPGGLDFSGIMARSVETGIISGVPIETSPMTEYTVFANNSQTSFEITFMMAVLADTDGDGLPDGPSVTGLEVDYDDDGDGYSDVQEERYGSDPLDDSVIPDVFNNIIDEEEDIPPKDEKSENNMQWYDWAGIVFGILGILPIFWAISRRKNPDDPFE